MTYFLELPDGTVTRCPSAAVARRYAELYIILVTGRAPVGSPLFPVERAGGDG